MGNNLISHNFTKIPNDFLEQYLPQMKPSEVKVVLAIMRRTIGFHRSSVRLSISKLMELTGLSRQGVMTGVKYAIERGLIQKDDDGGVTIWSLVGIHGSDQNSDKRVKDLDKDDQNLDTRVKKFDSTGQKIRPPSIKEKKKENIKEEEERKTYSPPPMVDEINNPVTVPEHEYFKLFHKDRWKNIDELQEFRSVESEVGELNLRRAIWWAAEKGIDNLKAIFTTARMMQSSSLQGKSNSQTLSEPKGFDNIRKFIRNEAI
jgi:phage replication O-like protein O